MGEGERGRGGVGRFSLSVYQPPTLSLGFETPIVPDVAPVEQRARLISCRMANPVGLARIDGRDCPSYGRTESLPNCPQNGRVTWRPMNSRRAWETCTR
jgi:hypothetical protein